ncbi:RNA chaperone Hfq [Laceyella putida]|uniref:RNA-binding protein Hfq n=1 Tax=Laceyella putida TaxID=110101 RepID=A0ABW2RL59_9BACL
MNNHDIQDAFLNQLVKEKIPVTIFLTNGFQYRGIIIGFDTFVVMLSSEGKQHMIYKQVISTIQPFRNVQWDLFTGRNKLSQNEDV